jgi:hypothetical protein
MMKNVLLYKSRIQGKFHSNPEEEERKWSLARAKKGRLVGKLPFSGAHSDFRHRMESGIARKSSPFKLFF